LLYDKHYDEQAELVDAIAERIQLLGGVSLAMAADVAETTQIERPPRGREEVPVQLSRLLDAHEIIIGETRKLARPRPPSGMMARTTSLGARCCAETNFIWFLSEHLVDALLVKPDEPSAGAGEA